MDPKTTVRDFISGDIRPRRQISADYASWTRRGGFRARVMVTERQVIGHAQKLAWRTGKVEILLSSGKTKWYPAAQVVAY